MQARQAIKFQYTDWAAADKGGGAAASSRFAKALALAADSQFVCPMEDALATLAGDDDDAVRIFR